MWHKPCRTFHPWCLCIKTRCLLNRWFQLDVEESRQWLQCIQYFLCSNDFAKFWSNAPDVGLFHKVFKTCLNSLRPRQNGRHFADDILECIFLNENVWISLEISLKFVPEVRINNIPALVQIMAWRRTGDKPLSELMMVSLLTHICVTRPHWVNKQFMCYLSRFSASRELAGTFQLPEHKGTIRTPNIIHKMPVRYILSSVWVRLSIFSQLSIIQSIIQYVGLCVFSLPTPLVMIERIYILCLIIIIKSEVWFMT